MALSSARWQCPAPAEPAALFELLYGLCRQQGSLRLDSLYCRAKVHEDWRIVICNHDISRHQKSADWVDSPRLDVAMCICDHLPLFFRAELLIPVEYRFHHQWVVISLLCWRIASRYCGQSISVHGSNPFISIGLLTGMARLTQGMYHEIAREDAFQGSCSLSQKPM